MKHFHDAMNAEKWNPNVTHKSSHEYDEKDHTIMGHDGENIPVLDSASESTVSKELHTAITPFSKTGDEQFAQSRTASSDAFKSKRRPKRSKLWMFLLSGFFISIISGVAMAFWLLPIGSASHISSAANDIDERETAFDDTADTLLSGEDQGYIPEGKIAMGNEDDSLYDELYANMADDVNRFEDTEYTEDDLSDFARDSIYDELYGDTVENDNTLDDEIAEDNLSDSGAEVSTIVEELAVEPVFRGITDTHEETGSITFKNDYAGDDQIASAISAIKENVHSKEKLTDKEGAGKPVVSDLAKKIEQSSVKKTAPVSSEKLKAEKVTAYPTETAGNNKTASASSNKILKPVALEKTEKQNSSDTKKDVHNSITQSISPVAQKADMKIIKKTKEVPVASDEGEQELYKVETVEISDKEILQTVPVPVKEPVKKPVMMAFIQEEASPQKTDDKEFKTGLSSILKEMRVNYEDQFNTNNNWPEYDNKNISAVIERGKYHIENKARGGSHTLLHPDGVPIDMDVMIDVSIASVRSSGENSYGFVFGAKNTMNNYSFLVRNGHRYAIEKMSDGIRTEIKGGKIDNIFIRGDAQKSMKIVKRQNMVRFYIDGHLMDEISNIDFFGDKMGFLVRGKVKMSVDSTYTQIRFQRQ